MLQNKKAVIFDLDGTLIDSMGIWHDIDVAYLSKYGHELPSTLQKTIEGMSFTETAIYFKEHFSLEMEIEQIKEEFNQMAFYKYRHEVPLKEGVYDFLTYLKNNRVKMGIATSNSIELVKVVLENLKINHFFDCIVTSCEVKKGKPHPDVYLEASRKLAVEPTTCLVFEDIIVGVLAGKSAGMTVCGVEDAFCHHTREEMKEVADYYIHSFFELKDLLKER